MRARCGLKDGPSAVLTIEFFAQPYRAVLTKGFETPTIVDASLECRPCRLSRLALVRLLLLRGNRFFEQIREAVRLLREARLDPTLLQMP